MLLFYTLDIVTSLVIPTDKVQFNGVSPVVNLNRFIHNFSLVLSVLYDIDIRVKNSSNRKLYFILLRNLVVGKCGVLTTKEDQCVFLEGFFSFFYVSYDIITKLELNDCGKP